MGNKCRIIFIELKMYLKVVKLSVKRCFVIGIGDEVIYNNEKHLLVQGVCAPFWDIVCRGKCKICNNSDRFICITKGYKIRRDGIHRAKFKKIRSLKNVWNNFISGYSFYKGYWLDIWINEAIEKVKKIEKEKGKRLL